MQSKLSIPASPSRRVLRSYFVLSYFMVFATMAMFWPFAATDTFLAKVFLGGTSAAYAALFLAIPITLTAFVSWALGLVTKREVLRRAVGYATAYLTVTLLLVSLYADYRLYALYEYHFNGFVWNLLTTPGGIAALGATDSTMLTAALQVALLCLSTAAPLWLLHRYQRSHTLVSRRAILAVLCFLTLVFVSEESVYAYSTYTGQEDYIAAADVVPFHLHASAAGLFKRMGIERTALKTLRIAGGEVEYPGKNLQSKPLAKYPNVIMLVGESFRWDLLDPEITPNLWKFSNQALRFEQHYSGGNRTRMGLFSMFYGIYSPYWYSFEQQRVAPALMNFLRSKDYQLALHTSQSFDYPELRHTLFSGISEQYMQELQSGDPWKRDSQNITDIIGKLEHRDPARPFYGFMFFESTHAPYTFPAEGVVRADYEKDLNYIRMNLKENVDKIHARYLNAAHHVDREVGRLLDYLKTSGMLDNTIVLFTGDHGEEFMEKGHWGHGHNASFPEEQIRVPLVLWMPGHKAEAIKHRTSHLQISQTLLEELGVTQDPHSYSSTGDLFSQTPYFVVGDYNYMAVFDEENKVTFPFNSSDFFRYRVHDSNDHPVARESRNNVVARYQSRIDEVVSESKRFVR